MKVHYLKEPLLKEDYIDVHYREESESIEVIRNFFLSFQYIVGKKDDCLQKLHPGSIYYLEVVDRKLFAYQEKEVYQLDYSLRSFLSCFETSGFVRIGKSAVAVLSQHYRFLNFPLSVVILVQYLILISAVMLLTWFGSFFEPLHENGYRDMFLSFTIPYIIGAVIYYISLLWEIRRVNRTLEEIRRYQYENTKQNS